MNRPLLIALFVALCLAQLYVPASMIWGSEATLTQGEPIKIRCQPVDPADPFRGRYVVLTLDMGEARVPEGTDPEGMPENAYVTLEPDGQGFMRWGEALPSKPASGLYVYTTVYPYWSEENPVVTVEPPFDRFYMNEAIAPEAERIYFEQLREAPQNCSVAARVLDGVVVAEELYLDNTPVVEYVRGIVDGEAATPMAPPTATALPES